MLTMKKLAKNVKGKILQLVLQEYLKTEVNYCFIYGECCAFCTKAASNSSLLLVKTLQFARWPVSMPNFRTYLKTGPWLYLYYHIYVLFTVVYILFIALLTVDIPPTVGDVLEGDNQISHNWLLQRTHTDTDHQQHGESGNTPCGGEISRCCCIHKYRKY